MDRSNAGCRHFRTGCLKPQRTVERTRANLIGLPRHPRDRVPILFELLAGAAKHPLNPNGSDHGERLLPLIAPRHEGAQTNVRRGPQATSSQSAQVLPREGWPDALACRAANGRFEPRVTDAHN